MSINTVRLLLAAGVIILLAYMLGLKQVGAQNRYDDYMIIPKPNPYREYSHPRYRNRAYVHPGQRRRYRDEFRIQGPGRTGRVCFDDLYTGAVKCR